MKATELLALLTEFYRDRLALRNRHVAAAAHIADYNVNNTYQYVINREETHLRWLIDALSEFGAPLPAPARELPAPSVGKTKKIETAVYRGVLEEDARELGSFVERWTPRVAAMTHARHRIMLNVVLGESMEHKRLFEQGAAGFEDLLGKRTGGVARQGGVLPTRWLE